MILKTIIRLIYFQLLFTQGFEGVKCYSCFACGDVDCNRIGIVDCQFGCRIIGTNIVGLYNRGCSTTLIPPLLCNLVACECNTDYCNYNFSGSSYNVCETTAPTTSVQTRLLTSSSTTQIPTRKIAGVKCYSCLLCGDVDCNSVGVVNCPNGCNIIATCIFGLYQRGCSTKLIPPLLCNHAACECNTDYCNYNVSGSANNACGTTALTP